MQKFIVPQQPKMLYGSITHLLQMRVKFSISPTWRLYSSAVRKTSCQVPELNPNERIVHPLFINNICSENYGSNFKPESLITVSCLWQRLACRCILVLQSRFHKDQAFLGFLAYGKCYQSHILASASSPAVSGRVVGFRGNLSNVL